MNKEHRWVGSFVETKKRKEEIVEDRNVEKEKKRAYHRREMSRGKRM